MTNKRRLAVLSSLTSAPLFAAPFLAIGDNAELFLTARTEARYEDNVTLAPNNEIDDVIFSLAPGAELLFGKNSLTQGSLVAQEVFNLYTDNNQLDSELTNILFKATYNGAKLQLGANAAYRQVAQNTPDTAADADLGRRDVYEAGTDAEYALTEKSKVGAGFSYAQTDYKSALYSDQTNYTVPVDYFFAIAPKLDLSAGVQYRETNVDFGSDSEDIYYNVGARGEFTPKLSGRFSVGYTTRDSDTSEEDGIGLRAGLSYAYSPKTSFSLDLSRDFQTAADASGMETTSIAVGASTSLTAALAANASLSYSNYDYLVGGRQDDYYVASLGVTYTYNSHVSVDAGYSFSDNSSSLATEDFTANVFRVAANFRY